MDLAHVLTLSGAEEGITDTFKFTPAPSCVLWVLRP